MTRALARFLAALGALAVAAALVWAFFTYRDEVSSVQRTTDAYVQGEVTTISPRVAGNIVAITVDDDQPVEARQVIVRIDPRDYRAAFNRAHALVGQADARLQEAKTKVTAQITRIAVAQATLAGAQAQATNAETTLGRQQALLSSPAGNRSLFDNATAAAVSARAIVTEAVANLSYERQQLDVANAEVAVAEANLATARASAYTAEIALQDTDIWSPITGIVASRKSRVGEYVSVGTRMLSIVPRDGLWIEANMRETQVGAIKPLDPVRIRLDTYPDQPICGYVEAVAPAAASEFALIPPDNATGNFTKIVRRFTVRVKANETDPNARLLRPGMSAEVAVATGSARAAFGCKTDPARDVIASHPPLLPEQPALLVTPDKGLAGAPPEPPTGAAPPAPGKP